ncbi:MAG: hypothetical protein O9264_06200 [Leptospira sp.]|nr:hypothetical protein [Leptospira sp.]
MDIFSSFTLPNGQVLSNHIVKAAMEVVADQMRLGKLTKRYRTWLKFSKHGTMEALVQKLSK